MLSRGQNRTPSIFRVPTSHNIHFKQFPITLSSKRFSHGLSFHKETYDNSEGTPFDFTPANLELAKKIISKYPPGYQKAATIPLLDIAQRQHGGWLPLAAMNKVAKILQIPPMAVYEVASFYTMFNRYAYLEFDSKIHCDLTSHSFSLLQ